MNQTYNNEPPVSPHLLPPDNLITLSADDLSMALHVASSRMIDSMRYDRKDSIFKKDWSGAYNAHLYGACGELALSKYLNTYPQIGVKHFTGGKPDATTKDGMKLEVRHRTKSGWDLIIREKDPDDRIFVLTRGMPPTITVVGWCVSGDAKLRSEFKKNWGGYGEAWFVPESFLTHPSKLKEL